MKPTRIQRKRIKGWRMPPNTVYVGRPTTWGNPFIVQSPVTGKLNKEESIRRYKIWLAKNGVSHLVIKELKGKKLACWCALDEPCHADILLKIANQ